MSRERAIHGFGWLLLIFAACLASASGTIALIAAANPPVREWASEAVNRELNENEKYNGLLYSILTLCIATGFAWKAATAPADSSEIAEAYELRRSFRRVMFFFWFGSMIIATNAASESLARLYVHNNGPMTNSTSFGSLGWAIGSVGPMCCILASSCLPMPSSPTTTSTRVDLNRPARGPIDAFVLKSCRGFVRRCGAAGRLFRRMARAS